MIDKKALHAKQVEMAIYLDQLCKDNNIDYYLIYGSALGAVRHQGFIPWDDDIDIGMTYENYKKFIDICENKLNKEKYFLQIPKTDKNYYLSFGKLRDITTVLIEDYNKDIDITYGVYIDIFPIVGVPKNKIKKKILEINRAFALSANINVINNKFLYMIFRILLKIIGKKHILKYCFENCVKYNCNDYQDWCSIFDGDGMEINMTTKNIMGKPTYVPFENTILPIPEDYDTYLKHIYHNYMQIPTPEDILKKQHSICVLDLEHSYGEYLKLANNK